MSIVWPIYSALKSLLALKKQNPKLKVIISVGGWEADGFSDAALSDESRTKFAESALTLLRQHHADGIDLDWEYPGQGVAGIKFHYLRNSCVISASCRVLVNESRCIRMSDG